MAFRWFRKHQKVIWAGIVIISMITFVLLPSGGGQSIFDRLAGSVRRAHADPVTTLYGKTVTVNDLTQLRQQRFIAERALGIAVGTASQQVGSRLDQLQKEMQKRLQNDPKAAGAFENSEEMRKLQEEMQNLRRAQTELELQFPDRRFVKALDETKALLDFMIWRHQADRLGIQFGRDAIDSQIRSMTGQRMSLEDVRTQIGALIPGADTGPLEGALADEFRVMAAQKAMLSYDPLTAIAASSDPNIQMMLQMQHLTPSPIMGVPDMVTPYDFWKYFQEQRTALNVALLPVVVHPGDEKPTEQDAKLLRAMYDRYKNTEPRPDSPSPGFKEPRRLRLEWARADPSSAYYQKASGEVVAALRVVNLQSLGTGTLLGGLPFVADPYYLTQYNELKLFGRLNMAGLTQPDFALSIYASRPQPRDVTAYLGGVLGTVTGNSPLAALAAYQADTAQSNAGDKALQAAVKSAGQERIPFGATLLLSAAEPVPSLAGPLGTLGLVAYGNETPQPLPAEAIRPQVEARVKTMLARDLALGNMKAFQDELEKVVSKATGSPEARQAAARAWVAEGLKKYHLDQHETMKDLRDQYAIATDPALKPLEEVYVREPGKVLPKADEEMGTDLFGAKGLYQPLVWPPNSSLTNTSPFDRDRQLFLVWPTEEQKAYVPSYEQAKDQVIAAWRLIRARDRAKAEAKQLQEKAAQTKGDMAKVVQLAAEQKLPSPIELRQVAREVPEPMPVAGGHHYQPFKFPDTIPYPGADWLNEMLNQLKEPGNTVVLANQPQTTFYVTVLEERTPPSESLFYDVYRDAAVSLSRDQLLDQLTAEQQKKYRDEFLKELRVEATGNPDGEFVFTDSYKKSLEGRGGEGE